MSSRNIATWENIGYTIFERYCVKTGGFIFYFDRIFRWHYFRPEKTSDDIEKFFRKQKIDMILPWTPEHFYIYKEIELGETAEILDDVDHDDSLPISLSQTTESLSNPRDISYTDRVIQLFFSLLDRMRTALTRFF